MKAEVVLITEATELQLIANAVKDLNFDVTLEGDIVNQIVKRHLFSPFLLVGGLPRPCQLSVEVKQDIAYPTADREHGQRKGDHIKQFKHGRYLHQQGLTTMS
jgi:hypothetical protein